MARNMTRREPREIMASGALQRESEGFLLTREPAREKGLTGKWGSVQWKELGVQDVATTKELKTRGLDQSDGDSTVSESSETEDDEETGPDENMPIREEALQLDDTHAPGLLIRLYRKMVYREGCADEWRAVYNPGGGKAEQTRIDKALNEERETKVRDLEGPRHTGLYDERVLHMLKLIEIEKEEEKERKRKLGIAEDNSIQTEQIVGTEHLARSIMKQLLKTHQTLHNKFKNSSETPTGEAYDEWRRMWLKPGQQEFDTGEKGLCRMLQVFEALGPYRWQDRFLRCMTIDLGVKLDKGGGKKEVFLLPRNMERNHAFSCRGQGVPILDPQQYETEAKKDHDARIEKANDLIQTLEWMVRRVNYRWLRSPGLTRERALHGVFYAWTPLLNDGLSAKTRLYWLKCLVDCDRESEVFKTLVARSFATKCWNSVKTFFYVDKGLREAWFIMLFLRVGRHVRAGEMPSMQIFSPVFFLIFNFYLSFSLISAELITIIVLFKGDNLTPKGGLRRYFSGWNVALITAEVFSVVAVSRWIHYFYIQQEAGSNWSHMRCFNNSFCFDQESGDILPQTCIDKTCWYYENSSLLMFIVFVKCNQLLVNLMCYRPVGEQVYVAFATMLHPSSLWFSSFMIFCGLSCVAAYYMLPIQENIVENWDASNLTDWREVLFQGSGFSKAIMKVFRIAIMGDFDTSELEGVDGVINFVSDSKTPGDTVYESDDGEPTFFHFGIQVFTIVVCVCFNVLLLNVYIGLLGSVYGTLATRRAEVFVEFRATFTVRALLLRTAANWLLSSCRPLLETIDPRWKSDPDSDERFKQHFIMYDTRVDKEIAALDLTHLGDDGGYEMAD